MEPAEKLAAKRIVFEEALNGFEKTLGIKTEGMDPVLADAVKNGAIQKFEYCSELCWNLIKTYLNAIHGVDTNSPKAAMREFLRAGMIVEEDYESLIQVIEERNLLSHAYNSSQFERIFKKLPEHLRTMRKALELAR